MILYVILIQAIVLYLLLKIKGANVSLNLFQNVVDNNWQLWQYTAHRLVKIIR